MTVARVILTHMDLRVLGDGPSEPFLSARDLFETEYDLEKDVRVRLRDDPDERTWTTHGDEYHLLNMATTTATSAMARELALHEFSHMQRNEQAHPSHTQSTTEAVYLALAGRSVDRQTLTHCYQIANHMKDIYADDITLAISPANKLITFLESALASAVRNRARSVPSMWTRWSTAADPNITAVNAAFALALCERHSLVGADHLLYDLAHAAANDAPNIDITAFKDAFRSLSIDPEKSEYKQTLMDITRRYAECTST